MFHRLLQHCVKIIMYVTTGICFTIFFFRNEQPYLSHIIACLKMVAPINLRKHEAMVALIKIQLASDSQVSM